MLKKLLKEQTGLKQEFRDINSQSSLYRLASNGEIALSSMCICVSSQSSTAEITWPEGASKMSLISLENIGQGRIHSVVVIKF